ncbi:MAG: hypothetical protein V3S44_07580 [Alphaproteobacteria bacterium]
MFISQALAHGASGASSPGGLGPFILLGVAILFVLVLIGEKKWRAYRNRRGESE